MTRNDDYTPKVENSVELCVDIRMLKPNYGVSATGILY